ncbi:hypothetical protein BH23ACT2_BH23ACT2_07230 [soil metagenome]
MTNEEGERLVRPTLRCLLEDLAQEVGPDELRVAIRTAEADMASDDTHLLPCPLTDAQHLVLDKANLLAGDEAAERERILAITDRHVIKVKSSDRRAALWQDEAGTWWLLAAGRRKNDGAGDFYRDLERFTDKDSAPIAPTDADQRYLRLEAAYAKECLTERLAHRHILEAVFQAARNPSTGIEAEAFGATVSIRIDPDEDGLAAIETGWEFDRFEEVDRFPYDVLAMVPGLGSTDLWEYLPPRKDSDSPHTWFAYVPQAWVDHLATSVEIDDLIDDGWTPPDPSTDGSEHFSHYAQSKVVTLAYVEGIEIVGLCGARVVAHRDYERFPVCPTCVNNLELLRRLRGDEGP